MRLAEQIGLALGSLQDVEVDEGLKKASEHGYLAVEISGDESFSDLGLRGLWPWERRIWNHIKPLLKPFHFKAYHSPYANLNFLTLNPVIRDAALEQIKASIDIAEEMGLSPVIVHPGIPREDMDTRVLDFLITTFLGELAAYAEEKKVKVAIETCEYFSDLSVLKEYIAKIDSPYLGICLDLEETMVEFNELDNDSLCEFIRSISGKLFHVRLHGMDTKWANGRLNYEEVCKTLIRENYNGAVIFHILTEEIDNINKTRDVIYKVG
ncbi:sugar phosphate isomerase/epimerase family protein [Anoxybacter fermentans]|nr:sugar phosphate isomerase/epimerase family protein [Anoxybacter fermentans]